MSTQKIKPCKTPGCDKTIVYRNGLPTSKYCPACTYKRHYAKARLNPKNKIKKSKIRTPRQCAIDRADEWCSKYVRLINGKVFGNTIVVECFTCGSWHDIKNIDCGHFINREIMPTRWEVNNLRPQDTHCNRYKSGRHHQFEQRLIKDIGIEVVNELKEKANEIANYSIQEIREIAKTYRVAVRLKEKELGVKIWK